MKTIESYSESNRRFETLQKKRQTARQVRQLRQLHQVRQLRQSRHMRHLRLRRLRQERQARQLRQALQLRQMHQLRQNAPNAPTTSAKSMQRKRSPKLADTLSFAQLSASSLTRGAADALKKQLKSMESRQKTVFAEPNTLISTKYALAESC